MRVWFAGGGTGGHLYPAIAIARALVAERPEVRPLFIGARRGVESVVLPNSGLEHELLDLHPLYRSKPWLNWKTMAGALGAWRRLSALARVERPAAVVATGGYASAMALLYAAVRGIPIALQEQNSFPGLTTRLFSRYATQVHLGFREAARGLKPRRAALVKDSGNPIDPPRAESRAASRAEWNLPSEGPAVLVFGGSQGARPINEAVAEWIAGEQALPAAILWITGPAAHAAYAHLNRGPVRVEGFVSPMSSAYAAADVAVARAGAMSTAELCAWGIPMVLIPLPTAAADHQTANARALENAGAAFLIPQSQLTAARLRDTITGLLDDPEKLARMKEAARARARPNAATEIARDIAGLLSAHSAVRSRA